MGERSGNCSDSAVRAQPCLRYHGTRGQPFSPCRAPMKILILGAAQVGSSVAAALATENNDITVVDTDPQRLRDLAEKLDIRTVTGHASRSRRRCGSVSTTVMTLFS